MILLLFTNDVIVYVKNNLQNKFNEFSKITKLKINTQKLFLCMPTTIRK